jgi:hypothetical protein
MDSFIKYCLQFYGPGGLYDLGATPDEIKAALAIRLERDPFPFEGDTVDRELVRDIITETREAA